MKKRRNEDGIYANGVDGEKDVLLFYVREFEGTAWCLPSRRNLLICHSLDK